MPKPSGSISIAFLTALAFPLSFSTTKVCAQTPANKTSTIYLTANKLISSADIQALDKSAKLTVKSDAKDKTLWSEIVFKLRDGSTVVLHCTGESSPAFRNEIEALDVVALQSEKRKPSARAADIYAISKKTKHIVETAPLSSLSSAGKMLVQQIAKQENALILDGNHIQDYAGRDLLNPNLKTQELPYFASARKRMEKSNATLRALKLKTVDFLPPIEGDEEVVLRSAQDVARRIIALWAVALKADGAKPDMMNKLLKDGHVAQYLTPKEKKFVENPSPSKDEMSECSWFIECIPALLYGLGEEDQLPLSSKESDVGKIAEKMVALMGKDYGMTFTKNAKLRSKSEILDAKDLTLRAHWLAVETAYHKKPMPAGINHAVLQERHRALNWLTKQYGRDWDKVQTGT